MSEILKPGRPPSRQERLHQVVTPTFTQDMGKRFRTIRMKLMLDQRALGKILGVSQNTISRLESFGGTFPKITLARLEAILGEWAGYVLLNSAADKINVTHIHSTYWDAKMATCGRFGKTSDNKSYVKSIDDCIDTGLKKEGD